METNTLKRTTTFLLLALSLILLNVTSLYAGSDIKLRYYTKGGDFTLTNQYGKKTSLSDFKGKVVLLFFGYTVCPDVCPTTLLEMKRTMEVLGEDAKKVQVIFVTIDPERDTEDMLKNYLAFFNPTFLGLRGTPEITAKVSKQYAVKYRKRDLGSAAGYLVDHTAFSFLIDQEGKLRYLFPFKTQPEFIAEAVRMLF